MSYIAFEVQVELKVPVLQYVKHGTVSVQILALPLGWLLTVLN